MYTKCCEHVSFHISLSISSIFQINLVWEPTQVGIVNGPGLAKENGPARHNAMCTKCCEQVPLHISLSLLFGSIIVYNVSFLCIYKIYISKSITILFFYGHRAGDLVSFTDNHLFHLEVRSSFSHLGNKNNQKL